MLDNHEFLEMSDWMKSTQLYVKYLDIKERNFGKRTWEQTYSQMLYHKYFKESEAFYIQYYKTKQQSNTNITMTAC